MKPIAFFSCLLTVVNSAAQDKIDTDRPDQTESAVLVPKKYFQAEFGFNRESSGGVYYTLVHPTFLLKYGLSKRFELRLESAFVTEYIRRLPDSARTTHFEPLEIGTKIAFFEERGLRPKTSLIFHTGSSFEGNHFQAWEFTSTLRLTCQNTLSKKMGLGYNIGLEKSRDETVWLYTLSPNMNIGERWYSYIELFGYRVKDAISFERSWQNSFDAGIAYFISNDAKLDLSAGWGLGSNSMNNYIALGFSFRVPVNKKFRMTQ